MLVYRWRVRGSMPWYGWLWHHLPLGGNMKRLSVASYRKDTLYPRVVKATARVLQTSDEISPVAILLQMGNLEAKAHDAWRSGQVPYLERVIRGSLSKANRILRLVGFHAHDLNMVREHRTYFCKHKRGSLQFSKSGGPRIEVAYACHFKWNLTHQKKQAMIERTLGHQKTGSGSG